VRETQRAAGPPAATAVMRAGEIAGLEPVDSWNRASAHESANAVCNPGHVQHNALDVLFDGDDATELLRFLSTCTLPS